MKVTAKSTVGVCVCVCDSVMSDSLQPMDCSPPGSSVHGILQSRILKWVAMSFSNYQAGSNLIPWTLKSGNFPAGKISAGKKFPVGNFPEKCDGNAGWSLTLRGIQPILLALMMEEGSQELRHVDGL